ncbi:MAG: hypothetical protein WA741_12760 [Candidatus Sulfotelmatobacter sp.]
MMQKSGIRKSPKQDLAKVLQQMDDWMRHQTRLSLLIDQSLFALCLRGRIVGRQEGLFLFDSHSETCRVTLKPESFNRVMCNQEGTVLSVELISAERGQMTIFEDSQEPKLEEMCADWFLSNPESDDQSVPITQSVRRS